MEKYIIILSNSFEFIQATSNSIKIVYNSMHHLIICHECNEALQCAAGHPGSIIIIDTIFSSLLLDKLYDEVNYNFIHCVAVCKNKNSVIKQLMAGAKDFLTFPLKPSSITQLLKKKSIGETMVTRSMNQAGHPKEKIAISTHEKVFIITAKNIIRCQSESNYTHVFMNDHSPIIVSKTLKDFEAILKGHNFLRIHRSHLVNVEHIIEYKRGQGGLVRMTDHKEIEVSTRKKPAFLQTFGKI